MHQQWKDRGNIECTEWQLCDKKKQIEDKTLLTPAEIEEVKQQVKSDNFQEEDGQQPEEEQQAVSIILEPVEPEVNPEPEHQYHQHIMKLSMIMMTMTMTMTNWKTNT